MAPISSNRLRILSERGAELIEFALVLPLLMLVILGIVDFGFVFQRLEVVTNAAREGARIAVLPGYSTTDAQWRAWNYIGDSGLTRTGTDPTLSGTNPVITVTDTTLSIPGGTTFPARSVQVVYTSGYVFVGSIMSWFGGSIGSVPLRGTAVMRCESGCP